MQNYLTYVDYEIVDSLKMANESKLTEFVNKFLQIDSQTRIICLLAMSSFLFTTISTFSDYWLYQMAAWPVPASPNFAFKAKQVQNTSDFIKKQFISNSGLWRICCSEDVCKGSCRILDKSKNFPEASGSSTSAFVIGAIRNSNIFPILSMLLILFGGILFFTGKFLTKPRIATSLTSGIIFVLSGLMNVLGLVIYISNNDKSSKKGDLPSYGWSFYLAAFAFMFSEIAGVMTVQTTVKQQDDSEEEKANIEQRESEKQSLTDGESRKYRNESFDSVDSQSQPTHRSAGNTEVFENSSTTADRSQKIASAGRQTQIANVRATLCRLDRIEEHTPPSGRKNIIPLQQDSIDSQLVDTEIKTPTLHENAKTFDNNLQKYKLSYSTLPTNSSHGIEPSREQTHPHTMLTAARRYNMKKAQERRAYFRKTSTEETDATSLTFASTESLPPPMEHMVPAPKLISENKTFSWEGIDLQAIQQEPLPSVLPLQSVTMLGPQPTFKTTTRKKKLKAPVVQRMHTFEKRTDLEEIEGFSSGQLPLSVTTSQAQADNMFQKRRSDSSLRSRVLRSLTHSVGSTSTESPSGSIRSSKTTPTSLTSPVTVCSATSGVSLVENNNQYQTNFLPSPYGAPYDFNFVNTGKHDAFHSSFENGGLPYQCQQRRRQPNNGGSLQRGKMATIDAEFQRAPMSPSSYYTLPSGYGLQQFTQQNHYMSNGNLLRNGSGSMITINPKTTTAGIRRCLSTNAICMREQKQKIVKRRSVMNIASKILNPGKVSKNSDADSTGKNGDVKRKIKNLFTSGTPKKSPMGDGTNGPDFVTGSTAV